MEDLEEGEEFSFTPLDSFFGPAGSSLPTETYSATGHGRYGTQDPVRAENLDAIPTPPSTIVHSHGQSSAQIGTDTIPTGERDASRATRMAIQPAQNYFTPQELRAIMYYTSTMFPTMFPFLPHEDARAICDYLFAALKELKVCLLSIVAQSNYCQESQLRRFGLLLGDLNERIVHDELAAIEGLQHKVHASEFLNDLCSDEKSVSEVQLCTTHILLSQVSFS